MGRRKAATKSKTKSADQDLEDTLSKLQDDLNKSFGDASVMRLNRR